MGYQMALVRKDEAGDPAVTMVEVTSWYIFRVILKRKSI